MTDTINSGPADATRIDVRSDNELRYWSDQFGCSEQQLIEAVNAVGVMVNDVELHLHPK